MSTSSDAGVSSEEIFIREDGNGFACCICTVEAICQNRREHASSRRHVRTIERFNLVFLASCDLVACKLCGAEFHWNSFKMHASWHRILPWHEPLDKYNKFFRNHMFEWESEFYCWACDVFFDDWSAAYIHVGDRDHVDAAKAYGAVNDFAWYTVTQVPYDIFVKEALTSAPGSRKVDCTICECINIAIANIAQHVEGTQHKQMKVEYVKELRDWKDNRDEMPVDRLQTEKLKVKIKPDKYRQPTDASKPVVQNLRCIYIFRESDNVFHCVICDMRFFNQPAIDDHIRGDLHLGAKKKFGCDNIRSVDREWGYYCSSCDCLIVGLKNVRLHVTDARHRDSLSGIMDLPKKQQAETVADPVAVVTTMAHIQTLNSEDFHCRLCIEIIFGNSKLQEHLTTATHLAKVQELEENIFHKQGNDYWCKCCSCVVRDTENIYVHINCYKHEKSRNDAKNREKPHDNAKSQSKTMESSQEVPTMENIPVEDMSTQQENTVTDPDTLLATMSHVETLTSQEFRCRVCNEVGLGDSELQEHLTSAKHLSKIQKLTKNIRHKQGNNYWCVRCDCVVPGIENIYRHINGFKHAMAGKTPKKQEKPNDNAKSPSKTMESSKKQDVPTTENSSADEKSTQQVETIADPDSLLATMTHTQKLNSKEFHCKLCNEIFSEDSKLQEHLTEAIHLSKTRELTENISHKHGNGYWCKCCNCVIPGIDNIYGHINGSRHAKSQSCTKKEEKPNDNAKSPSETMESSKKQDVLTTGNSSADEKSTEQVETIADPGSLLATMTHTQKLNSKEIHCKLCNEIFSEDSKLQEHLTEAMHLSKTRELTTNISHKHGNDYWCVICNCVISGIDNIYGHVNGSRHAKSKTKKEENVNGTKKEQNVKDTKTKENANDAKTKENANNAKTKENANDAKTKKNANDANSVKKEEAKMHETATTSKSVPESSKTIEKATKRKTSIGKTVCRPKIMICSLCDDIFESTEDLILHIYGHEYAYDNQNEFRDEVVARFFPACAEEKKKSLEPSKKSKIQKILQLLNLDDDFIHDMKQKSTIMEFSLRLSVIKSSNKIRCLVCRVDVNETLETYYQHLNTVEHCQRLDGLENDFDTSGEPLSEFELVCQFMELISKTQVHCHACDKSGDNVVHAVRQHMIDPSHKESCRKMYVEAKKNYEKIEHQFVCDWYAIDQYLCVPCGEHFDSELFFTQHLRSHEHECVMKCSENRRKTVLCDFCSICGLLWFGFRSTYANHCETSSHVKLQSSGRKKNQFLPKTAETLLGAWECYIDDAIEHFGESSDGQRDKEATLLRDIEMTVKKIFPDAKAHTCGSKISGLRSGNSDYDVFLDCGNMYDGKDSSARDIMNLSSRVYKRFVKYSRHWDGVVHKRLIDLADIRASHRATGLTCEISFDNGLAVESAKLIKYFVDLSALCRKLVLFFNRWLDLCDIAAPRGISRHAIHWCVIFYLQTKSLLPSVAALIAIQNDSRLIAGWEVGVSLDFAINVAASENPDVLSHIEGFFTFYGNFDYRYKVACPLLGRAIEKRAFADPQSLPGEMAPYKAYATDSPKSHPFGIDGPMCIQDPLNLQRNLADNVTKAQLNRFREYCLSSLRFIVSKPM